MTTQYHAPVITCDAAPATPAKIDGKTVLAWIESPEFLDEAFAVIEESVSPGDSSCAVYGLLIGDNGEWTASHFTDAPDYASALIAACGFALGNRGVTEFRKRMPARLQLSVYGEMRKRHGLEPIVFGMDGEPVAIDAHGEPEYQPVLAKDRKDVP